jgi:hypothetical protein
MSRLLINEPPLQVLPSLAVKIGLQEAIVLQQIHYWVQQAKPKGSERWVYNTYEQWAIQFPFWSPEAIRKIFKNLRDRGLVLSRPRASHAFDRVNEYTVNYEQLALIEAEKFTASGRTNLPLLYTENSSETTQEKPHKAAASRGITLRVWLESLKTSGAEAIPATDAVFTYAAKSGIPDSFLELAWAVFRADHLEGSGAKKLQKDWRQTFRNYVEKNYLKLWYVNAEGAHVLTTPGIQAQRVHEVAA